MVKQYWGVVMIDGGINDIRGIGTATLVLVLLLAIVGMDWVTKVRYFIWNIYLYIIWSH